MKNFTNVNIKKEYNRLIRNLIISIVVIVLGIGFKIWETEVTKEANKNKQNLDTIIVNQSGDKTYKLSYIDIKAVPYQFAVSDATVYSYYFLFDGKYLYIAYMSPSQFNELDVEDIETNPIRVEGVTKSITEEIKNIALEVYNEDLEEEKQISYEDFENYFGDVYLDMTEPVSSVAGFQWFMFYACVIVGGIAFIICLSKVIKFNKKINKLDTTKIFELDSEMNNGESFYYSKIHLYLTPHYIINFSGYFNFIRYEDVLWMYRYEVRTNGAKSSQSIKVLANDGITYLIATIGVYSKKQKEIYEEIWNTIYSKNPSMRLGYTEENINDMNEKIKQIRGK